MAPKMLIAELKADEVMQGMMQIMDYCIDGIFIEDTKGNILTCNKAGARMFGYTKEELEGMNIIELIYEEDAAYTQAEYTSLDVFADEYIERINKKKDGTLLVTAINSKIMTFNSTEYLIAFVRDMSEEVKMRERLSHLANYDELSSLKNRRAIFQVLKEKATPYGLAVLDLDHFKRTNDKYGHVVGDLFIETLGRLLSETEKVEAGRIGGEEFLLILDTDSGNEAKTILEELLQRANESLTIYGGIRFSAGVMLCTQNKSTENYGKADKLCYKAKRQGKNCVVLG